MPSTRVITIAPALAICLCALMAGTARGDFDASFDLVAAPPVSLQPQVAVDLAGNSHFVWVRDGGLVQTRRRAADGTLGAVQELVATDASGQQVAVDSAGNAHFVWRKSIGGGESIVQTRRRAVDGTLGAVQDLSAASENIIAPQVAVDSAGNAHFAWHRIDSSDSIVQTRRRAADGTLGSVQDLSTTGPGSSDPKVALDSAGNAHFAWYNGTGGLVQTRRRAADGTLGAVQAVALASPNTQQLAVDSAGNVHFVWGGSDSVVRTRRLAADGTLGAAQDLSGQIAARPQVAVDSAGNAHFAWDRAGAGVVVVQTRRLAADGTLGAVQDISSGQAVLARVGVDSARNARFVWSRTIVSNGMNAGTVIQARRLAADGTLGAVQDLSGVVQIPSTVSEHQLAVSAGGGAAAVWQRDGTIQGAFASDRLDTDGDALLNSWETDGIDIDNDDTPELDLPAMGADPNHKDVFVEVDFIAGHRIDQSEIDKVIEAYEIAPVSNPDGNTGITLHVDNGSSSVMDAGSSTTWGSLSDQDSLTHQDVLGSGFVDGEDTRYDWSQFEAFRQTKFLTFRRTVFHYAIAAHSGPDQDWAGLARGGAADFIVAMHENCGTPLPLTTECTQEPDYTASTFMHELGHNLGLGHGGTDGDKYKPNYLSVMNYLFGWGLQVGGGVQLDYSRFNLSLDEDHLDEEIGFGITSTPLNTYETIFRCAGGGDKYRISLTPEFVDWNCDRSITSIGTVSTDVSDDGKTTALTGPIDWDKLDYANGGIGAPAAPPGPADTVIDEPTPTELRENREVLQDGTAPPFDSVQLPPAAGGGSALPASMPPAVKKCKKGFKRVKGKCRKKKRKK